MAVDKDLVKERQNATINCEDFADWWSGGKIERNKRKELESIFFNDTQFDDPENIGNFSYKQLYEHTLAKSVKVILKLQDWHKQQKEKQKGEANTISLDDLHYFSRLLRGPLGTGLFQQNFPLRLHYSMFLTALLSHSNEEQSRIWLEKAWHMYGIIGTYAQTELGHGTYLRGLETRADYDVEKQEFILNTPTLTAYKWWPGGLGHSANMVILMAQLYIKNKHYGLQPFLVRIRNVENHAPEIGVDVGDIGPKLGINGVNNGFLCLKNVRIPLNQMLSKHNQVLPDGTFVKGPEPLMLYGTMSYVRVMIVNDASFHLLQAATIATRYSAIRRQGTIIASEQREVQILDFLTQQHKLFPQISKGIFYRLAADYIWNLYRTVHKELDQGNKRNLAELHALSCCLKAVCSHEAAKGVEILRKACGGHGYLQSSNFHTIYAAATAACTYEGENTVLLLQTAKFLVKYFEECVRRKYLPKSVEYFRSSGQIKWCLNLESIVKTLEFTSLERIKYTFLTHRSIVKEHKTSNRAGLLLTKAAILHGKTVLARIAFDAINKHSSSEEKLKADLEPVMNQLLSIFILEIFLTSLEDILRFNRHITDKEIKETEQFYEDMLMAFRPNAVAIVDGFEFHDRVLGSTLGCYNGRAYERLLEDARKCDLNQKPVNANYATHLKQLFRAKL